MSNVEDKLRRDKEIDSFASIILNQESKVISINSPWGTGKSTFIDLLIQKIENEQKALCIKYNAWESDYFDNPLIPLLYQITSHPQLNKEESLKTQSTNFSRQYTLGISGGMNFFVKADVNANVGFSAEDFDLLDSYKNTKEAVESFKKILKEVQYDVKQPIIIFIDELDRCRPDYAIETLEIIKHFFNIEHITFVIAVDKKQLNNSITTLYGINAETEGFLRKFIDIELYLPEPDTNKWIEHLFSEHKYKILSKLNNFKTFSIPDTDLNKEVEKLSTSLGFSLRDIDKIILRLSLILDIFAADKKNDICINYLIILIVVQQKFNHIYKKLKNGDFILNGTPSFKENIKDQEIYRQLVKNGFDQYINKLTDIMNTYRKMVKSNNTKEEIDLGADIIRQFQKNKFNNYILEDIKEYLKSARGTSTEENWKYLFDEYFEKIDLINNILK